MRKADQDQLVGRMIAGKYVVEDLIGTGAMGAVFRARQVALEKTVAIKVMHGEHANDPAFATRFHREAKAASRLNHPNSIQILDFGAEPDGLLYIAMEYLDGRSLHEVLRAEWPLAPARVADIVMQTLAALAVAHDTGVVHRDLKPENVMVQSGTDDDGRPRDVVKVCDFGIAKITDPRAYRGSDNRDSEAPVTTAGFLVGTPEYMSPEQGRGEKLDLRSDLYSVGIILYEMLTKRVPFDAENAIGVVLKHITEEPVAPSKVVAGVDPRLEAIALKALRKLPADRYASAREMRIDLRQVGDRAGADPSDETRATRTSDETRPRGTPDPMRPAGTPDPMRSVGTPDPMRSVGTSDPMRAAGTPAPMAAPVVAEAAPSSARMAVPTADETKALVNAATVALPIPEPSSYSGVKPTSYSGVKPTLHGTAAPVAGPPPRRRGLLLAIVTVVALIVGASGTALMVGKHAHSDATREENALPSRATPVSPGLPLVPATPATKSSPASENETERERAASHAALIARSAGHAKGGVGGAAAVASATASTGASATGKGAHGVPLAPPGASSPPDAHSVPLAPVAASLAVSPATPPPPEASAAPPTPAPEAANPPSDPGFDPEQASVDILLVTAEGVKEAEVSAALRGVNLTQCYKMALRAKGSRAPGTAIMNLSFDADGLARSAIVTGGEFLPGLTHCVQDAATGMRLKGSPIDPGGGVAEVTLGFREP